MSLLHKNHSYLLEKGFTTSEVVVSVALLAMFYGAILTFSSIVSSNSRSSEIRPALDQVVTLEHLTNPEKK